MNSRTSGIARGSYREEFSTTATRRCIMPRAICRRRGCAMVKRRRQKNSSVTIRDVAHASGFSSTTVSFVLNDAPLARFIPAKTKDRIRVAAKKLGYRPHLLTPFMRSKRSHAVGVMVFDMTDPYCTLILRGVENALYQASYLPMLADAHNEKSRFERYLE